MKGLGIHAPIGAKISVAQGERANFLVHSMGANESALATEDIGIQRVICVI